MVDKIQNNDEYEFNDIDSIDPNMVDTSDDPSLNQSLTDQKSNGSKNVKRNALIAVGVIIALMIIYKFIGAIISSKPPAVKPAEVTPSLPPIVINSPKTIQPVTAEPSIQDADNIANQQLNQKLAALEVSQASVHSEVSGVTNQINSLNTSISDLTNKMTLLNESVTSLTAKVTQQARQIAILTARTTPKKVQPAPKKHIPLPVYDIQAIIPGRAWLVATNGSTLTVREGTIIPGYGTVKLIDPDQGQLITSSGKIIKFSQQDS